MVCISKDAYLNKASIKYLENRLHAIGVASARYGISAQNTLTRSSFSEPEMAKLEEFLSNIKLLTSTFGHKMFEGISETVSGKQDQEAIFYCKLIPR